METSSKNQISEAKLQKKVLDLLKENEWFTFKTIVNNKAGIPDVCAIKNGFIIWLEIKKGIGGRISPIQKHVHKQMKDHGANVYTIKCIEDLKEVLDEIERF